MKCGYCRRKGHYRTSCPDFKKLAQALGATVETSLKWDVIRNLILKVDKLEGEIEFLSIENELVWEEMHWLLQLEDGT